MRSWSIRAAVAAQGLKGLPHSLEAPNNKGCHLSGHSNMVQITTGQLFNLTII